MLDLVTAIPTPVWDDQRGVFVKPWPPAANRDAVFLANQVFWSRSACGVVRGMHLPVPPNEGRKLVFVVAGEVRDFTVDTRRHSPHYAEVVECHLNAYSDALCIPAGVAHGFEVLVNDTIMVYVVEGRHEPSTDLGFSILDLGIDFVAQSPILSSRDRALPSLERFLEDGEEASGRE